MKAAVILHLLPHHQEIIPPKQYVRKYFVDSTKLSLAKPNSLASVFPIVQKLFLNFVTIAHYLNWHFADLKHAQQILQDEFHVPQKIFYHALSPFDYFT